MINSFQLRVALSVTNITTRELAQYLGVTRTMISSWCKKSAFDTITSQKIDTNSLIFFLEQYNIKLLDKETVELNLPDINSDKSISRFNLRGARAALGITQYELAKLVNLTRGAINYYENHDNTMLLSEMKKEVNESILSNLFSQKGITFPNSLSLKYFKQSH